MVNPLIGTLALTPAEQAINFLIQDDPHLADLIEPFTGKLLEVETRQPAATFTVLFESGRIRLSSLEGVMTGVHPDAKVIAPASVLLSMLSADAASRGLVNPELELSGDVEWIQALLRALHRADIQWRDLLGAILGDSLSGQLVSLVEAGSEWAGQSNTRLRRNLEDYLREEIRVIPGPHEADRFADQLHDLRLQLDRLAARAQALDERLSKRISN
ncbi:MAG: ubiquinone biosynthesis accessory factor UbiJ [Pseudohongiellaceae bacterium]